MSQFVFKKQKDQKNSQDQYALPKKIRQNF